MSSFTAIRAVSSSIGALLRRYITESDDGDVGGVPISRLSPRELREREGDVVSVWLYQVVRNAETLNHPPRRISRDTRERHPLPVNIHFLVTPLADSSEMEHALLGRVLQVFNDHSVLEGPLLTDDLAADGVSLRLSLQPMTLEELTAVWDALREPYQLSVAYVVQVVEIDSLREPLRVPPVLDAESNVGAIG